MSRATPSPEVVMLGASSLEDGTPKWQAFLAANDNDDEDDRAGDWGEVPVYQALGVTSQPAAKDDRGHAEAVILPNVGGRRAVAIGGRDTRDAAFIGKLDPGDTVLHSTGSNKAAQFRAQDKKRAGSIIVRCEDGEDIIILADGKNKKLQIMARGAAFQIDEGGDISIANKGGAAIMLQGSKIALNGELQLPGMPPGMFIMCSTMAPGPVTTPAVVGSPCTLVPGTWMPLNGVGGYT